MKDDRLRFIAKTRPGLAACIIWTGAVSPSGYGAFKLDGRTVTAHRAAYELFVRPIPFGCVIRHTCHNPLCVNPDHLKPGSHRDNVIDRVTANRSAQKIDRATRESISNTQFSERECIRLAAKHGISYKYVKRLMRK